MSELTAGSAFADEPAEVDVHESDLVLRGAVWDVRRDRFAFGGTELVREYQDHTGAVAVIALDAQDRLLMIRQYRHPIGYRDWEIPAGLMDAPGEGGLAAAQRELAEETDTVANEWHLLLDMFLSPGGSSETMRIFLARDLAAAPNTFAREGEEAELEPTWVPLDDAVDAVFDGRIGNAVAVSAILAAHTARAAGWRTLRDPHTPWERRRLVRGERSRG